MKKLVLIDADGVVLNWDDPFEWWAKKKYGIVKNNIVNYRGGVFGRYAVSMDRWTELTSEFNSTDEAGNLPPHRDAIRYIRQLHEQHGFVFQVITSFGLHPRQMRLRTENLKRYFGTAIYGIDFTDLCGDKTDLLRTYEGTDLPWVEDKVGNCIIGASLGLRPYLMMHEYNFNSACDTLMEDNRIIPVANWNDLCYNHLVK